MKEIATIADLKKCDKIAQDRIKKSGGSWSQRFEYLVLDYDNVYLDESGCLMIRLANATHKSVWNYV